MAVCNAALVPRIPRVGENARSYTLARFARFRILRISVRFGFDRRENFPHESPVAEICFGTAGNAAGSRLIMRSRWEIKWKFAAAMHSTCVRTRKREFSSCGAKRREVSSPTFRGFDQRFDKQGRADRARNEETILSPRPFSPRPRKRGINSAISRAISREFSLIEHESDTRVAN